MRKQHRRLCPVLLTCVLFCASAAYARDKKPKATPVLPNDVKDAIEVVGHIPSTGVPVTRFLSTQHYSSYYLYVEHEGGAGVSLIDVTKTGQPAVLADVAYFPGSGSENLLQVAGTAALVDSGVAAVSQPIASQTLRIMDFSDPRHPKIAREFTGVTAIGGNDPRGLIYLANADGIWILKQHLAEDPAVEKAYANYVLYGSSR